MLQTDLAASEDQPHKVGFFIIIILVGPHGTGTHQSGFLRQTFINICINATKRNKSLVLLFGLC